MNSVDESKPRGRRTTVVADYWRRYWGVAVLLVWGGAILGIGLVRFSPYHLAESSARSLLLTWSLVEHVATPISLAHLPDLRALLLIPAAVYWPGSVAAAKVFSLLFAFAAVTLLYRWSARSAGRETALIASAVVLIAPLMLKQIDAIGAGPLLLLAFGVGAFLDGRYRASHRLFGGWYFFQMLVVAFAVSLHPAGLAYPAALAWGWFREPLQRQHQKYLYLGLILAPLFMLMFGAGWVSPDWFANPLSAAAGIFSGAPAGLMPGPQPLGLITLIPALTLLAADRRFLMKDMVGRMLLSGALIGAVAADGAWAMILLALLAYRGTYYLIRLNEAIPRGDPAGRRGVVLLALFVAATSFMVQDKTYAHVIARKVLSPVDALIRDLSRYSNPQHPIRVASQWPGRTMIACKCYTLPLPPAAGSGSALMKSVQGVDYIVFNPKSPGNHALFRNLAQVSNRTETMFMDSRAGMIVRIKKVAAP